MTKRQLQALTQKWYQKLKKSGFDDIEMPNGKWLKQYHNEYYQARYTPLEFQNKEEYFRKARHFLIEHAFESEKDRLVWQLHSEGLSLREITKKLKIKLKHHHVGDIIVRLRNIMLHGITD